MTKVKKKIRKNYFCDKRRRGKPSDHLIVGFPYSQMHVHVGTWKMPNHSIKIHFFAIHHRPWLCVCVCVGQFLSICLNCISLHDSIERSYKHKAKSRKKKTKILSHRNRVPHSTCVVRLERMLTQTVYVFPFFFFVYFFLDCFYLHYSVLRSRISFVRSLLYLFFSFVDSRFGLFLEATTERPSHCSGHSSFFGVRRITLHVVALYAFGGFLFIYFVHHLTFVIIPLVYFCVKKSGSRIALVGLMFIIRYFCPFFVLLFRDSRERVNGWANE